MDQRVLTLSAMDRWRPSVSSVSRLLGALCLVATLHCGGSVQTQTPAGEAPGSCPPAPANGLHRAQATTCAPTPPGSSTFANPDGGSPDSCLTDNDCTSGGACACNGATYGWGHSNQGNQCVAGNCRVDSDCGPGGFCSPTVDFGCGAFYGVAGFYCRSCADTCTKDSDCTDGAPAAGYCAYDPTVGHFACGYGFCAG